MIPILLVGVLYTIVAVRTVCKTVSSVESHVPEVNTSSRFLVDLFIRCQSNDDSGSTVLTRRKHVHAFQLFVVFCSRVTQVPSAPQRINKRARTPRRENSRFEWKGWWRVAIDIILCIYLTLYCTIIRYSVLTIDIIFSTINSISYHTTIAGMEKKESIYCIKDSSVHRNLRIL